MQRSIGSTVAYSTKTIQPFTMSPTPALDCCALQGEVVVDEAFAAKAAKASGLEAGGSPLILLDG